MSAIGFREVAELGVAMVALIIFNKLSHRQVKHSDRILDVVVNNTEVMGQLRQSVDIQTTNVKELTRELKRKR